MKIKYYLAYAILTAIITSCGEGKVDTTAARKEMEAREVKVVPEARVLERAMEMGKELLETDDSQIKKYRFDDAPALAGKEQRLFEAYVYNAGHDIKSEANVQTLEDKSVILFTAPWMKADQMVGMISIRLNRKDIVNSISD